MRTMDRHWKESQAQGDYARNKRVYEEAAVKFAEAVFEHGDLEHTDVAAAREAFRLAKVHKDNSWRILKEVMF